MIPLSLPSPLLAVIESAEQAQYEWTRWEGLRHSGVATAAWLLGALLLLAVVWIVYRREARTVSLGKAIFLASLRTVAIAGAALFFLGLEKRSSHEETVPSRVVVLADTSLSMDLPHATAASGNTTSRAGELTQLLTSSPLLEQLSATHEVDVVGFGETTRPLAHLPVKQTKPDNTAGDPPSAAAPPFSRDRLATELAPAGRETHWGDALAETLERYRGLPVSSIIVLSDGGQNMGLDPLAVTEAATKAGVRIHTVGFGPLTAPPNIAVRELIAPERVFPGDVLTLQGLVQADELEGRELEAQLLRRPIEPPDAPWQLVDSQTATAGGNGDLITLRFDTVPEEPGQFEYELRLSPIREEAIPGDNSQRVEVAVVERKTKVLLFAGGPARDYLYLRNQLHRDKSFTVDVLLQTATEGVSQDANAILTEFPDSAEELASYDALVALDPDWSVLSVEQAQLLDQWVSRGAGGMVVTAGNIHTPHWGNEPVMRVVRGLYPLRFADRLTLSSGDSRPRTEPLPLKLTRAGEEAKFLWLGDSLAESREAWQEFEGVFGIIPSLGPKAGATVLGEVVDSNRGGDSGLPYITEHYYGAGQVLAFSSAETWRLRTANPDYFDRLWTQLLRHVSQGRLLQGSPRGKLLVAQDRYEVGATVAVRAIVSDLQFQPATLPVLPLLVERPDGGSDTFDMKLDPQRPGNYAAELRVVLPGTYNLQLTLPESEDVIERKIRVSVPQLELKQGVRDQRLLAGVAKATGGHYYPTAELALNGSQQLPSVIDASPSESRTYRVKGQVDEQFASRQAGILLAIIAGALCLEWVVRRLSYLA